MGLDLSKFYIANNFKFEQKMAYGIYRNRVVSVVSKGNFVKATISFNQQLVKEQGEKISFKMSEIKHQYRVLQNAITTNLFLELTMFQSAEINDEFQVVLDKCMDVLDAENLPTCEICPLCGQVIQTNAPFVKVRNSVIQAHEQCVEQFLFSAEKINQSQKKESKKKLKTTIAISLLSMAIIVAICTLLSFATEFVFVCGISSMSFFITFKQFSKREKILLTKQNIIILGIFATLTAILSIYFGISMYVYSQLMEEVSIGVVYKDFFNLLLDPRLNLGKIVLYMLLINCVYIFIEVFANIKRAIAQDNQIKKL